MQVNTTSLEIGTHIRFECKTSPLKIANGRICVLTALIGAGADLVAHNDKRVRKLFAGKLANVPGHTLTVEVVDFPPGYKSDVHHHAGSVFAYVLTGRIRSQNSATGRPESTKQARRSSSRPEAIIWSPRIRAPANPQVCWLSTSQKTEQSSRGPVMPSDPLGADVRFYDFNQVVADT
jgi:hypothetical protein